MELAGTEGRTLKLKTKFSSHHGMLPFPRRRVEETGADHALHCKSCIYDDDHGHHKFCELHFVRCMELLMIFSQFVEKRTFQKSPKHQLSASPASVLFTVPLRQRLREQPSNGVVMGSLLPHDDELAGENLSVGSSKGEFDSLTAEGNLWPFLAQRRQRKRKHLSSSTS